MLATASVDRTIRIHDLRMASSSSSTPAAADGGRSCIATLLGHDYAIRRVAWSPHAADVLASSGYDMTCRTWKIDGLAQQPPPPPGAGMAHPRMTDVYDQHREFVIGLAWSLFEAGVLATVSWDQECHVYVPNVA
jgi:peroxin-7